MPPCPSLLQLCWRSGDYSGKCSDLSDIKFMGEILTHVGADVSNIGPGTWKIHPANIQPNAPYELVRKMRASICLLGPLVARLKKAKVPMPGGCVIGHRPIDLHLHALGEMGATITLNQGVVEVDGSKLISKNIFIGGRHGSTVTGTANAIMAAVLTPGQTTLDGAACEPEIVDLCKMLGKMGAKISGAGSHLISIEGVENLNGCNHRVIPDRIEAATYIMAAAITRGKESKESTPASWCIFQSNERIGSCPGGEGKQPSGGTNESRWIISF